MTYQISDCVIWSSGVDWLTVTYKPDDPNAEKCETLVGIMVARRLQDGYKRTPQRLRDYTGYGAEGIYFGARADGYIAQATGAQADALTRLLLANGCVGKPSRVDFQTTVKFREDFTRRATEVYCNIHSRAAQENRAQTLGLTLVETNGRGDSIAIGRRTSASYRRVYDKTREQRGQVEANLWRWEVEYKAERALQSWEALERAGSTMLLSKAIVVAEFTRLGIVEPWMQRQPIEQMPSCYEPTDNERRLRWLQNNVSASFQKLKKAGLENEALDALGATHLHYE